MLTDEYAKILTEKIDCIRSTQRENIEKASQLLKTVIENDGLIYVFGCGHSHMLSEEAFYRAGGLGCVCPIFFEPLMLHESAALSSRLEKQDGLYEKLLENCSFSENDAVICISNSGVNSVPVEFAAAVKALGLPLIGIASSRYLQQEPHNPLNAHLQQLCTVCIDNCAPHGDACLQIEKLPVKMTPVSTVTGAFILNSLLAEASALAAKEGFEVPVFLSGNIPGGSEYNRALIEKYSKRVKYL